MAHPAPARTDRGRTTRAWLARLTRARTGRTRTAARPPRNDSRGWTCSAANRTKPTGSWVAASGYSTTLSAPAPAQSRTAAATSSAPPATAAVPSRPSAARPRAARAGAPPRRVGAGHRHQVDEDGVRAGQARGRAGLADDLARGAQPVKG